jgi:uncharacterized protein YciI
MISFAFTGCSNYNGHSEDATGERSNRETTSQSLAAKYGADEYGMKTFVVAFLKKGPVRDQDSITVSKIQRGHLDNIKRLSDSGKLLLAGPFLENDELRGIFIFNVSTLEAAKTLTETDPAIKSGRLEMELHLWYGSAALLGLYELHEKIAKKSI